MFLFIPVKVIVVLAPGPGGFQDNAVWNVGEDCFIVKRSGLKYTQTVVGGNHPHRGLADLMNILIFTQKLKADCLCPEQASFQGIPYLFMINPMASKTQLQ